MNYLIFVFFVTDIWIFAYRFLLHALNQNFPSQPSSSFLVPGVNPEPFEAPLYLLLTLGMNLTIYFMLKSELFDPFRQVAIKYRPQIKWTFLLLLLVIFWRQLGEFPLNREMRGYSFVTPFIDQMSILVMLSYVLILGILTLGVIFLYRNQRLSLTYISVTLIIAFLTFEPGFPISYLDYAPFFGPILEIGSGKTIYTEIQSHYGFFSVFIPGLLLRIGLFNVVYLPFFVWSLYVIQYGLSFYLVLRISKSMSFALVSLFSIMTLNYFSLMHLPISVPQSGALRWLPMIIVPLLFYKLKNIHSRILIFLTVLLSFFIPDVGIAIILAYILTLLFLTLRKQTTPKEAGISLIYLFLFLTALFITINFGSLLAGYHLIEVGKIFTKINQYGREGFGMLPIPDLTYFWWVVLFYFASVAHFFKKRKIDFVDCLIILIANLSLLGSIYYVGRSHPNNLMSISILPLLNLFILIAVFYRKISSNQMKFFLCLLIFFLLIAVPAFNRRVSLAYISYEKIVRVGIKPYEEKLPQNLIYQFCRPEKIHIFDTEINECVQSKYRLEKEFITASMPDEEIVMLSPDDTYLFYLTGKKNMLQVNPQASIFTRADLSFALGKAALNCPQRIMVDPRVFNPEVQIKTLNFLYTVQQNLFEEIQRACKFQYLKSQCTENLCLAEVVDKP